MIAVFERLFSHEWMLIRTYPILEQKEYMPTLENKILTHVHACVPCPIQFVVCCFYFVFIFGF